MAHGVHCAARSEVRWPIAAPSRLADVREAPLQVGFHLMLTLEGSHRLAAADAGTLSKEAGARRR